ncbi:MAG: hypothetical protein KZQ83_15875 [gamma proteobacterium symbiont of Taylorina sp.]|nr:hypothetical protein [gamma proteobacterium symbiont of Taylorina sp.]
MSNQIKKPEWFNIEKYDDAHTATFEQWFFNLSARIMAILCCDGIISSDDGCLDFTSEEEVKKCRTDGFAFFEVSHAWEVTSSPGDNVCISPFTLNNFYYKHNTSENKKIFSEYLSDSLDWNNEGFLCGIDEEEEILSFLAGSYGTQQAVISVDLEAPIDTLMEQFNNFILKEKKKKGLNIKKGVTENDIKKWSDLNLIAFLDLLLWQKQEGKVSKKGIQAEIVRWIHPSGYVKGKLISSLNGTYRTLNDIAEIMLDPNFIFSMAKQETAIDGTHITKKSDKPYVKKIIKKLH